MNYELVKMFIRDAKIFLNDNHTYDLLITDYAFFIFSQIVELTSALDKETKGSIIFRFVLSLYNLHSQFFYINLLFTVFKN